MIEAPHSPLLSDIARHAAATPHKIALVEGDARISYSQLVDRIEAAAGRLRSLGLDAGDRVVLAAQKEVAFVDHYFACHLLGVVNVVVDPALPPERLRHIIAVTKPKLAFGNGLQTIDLPCLSWADAGDNNAAVHQPVSRALHTHDVADVMFTTGTTGDPKGVCLTHANIAGSAGNTNAFVGTGSLDVEALALPLSHSFGLGRLRCVLTAGATLVLVGGFANLKLFFNTLTAEGVTGFGMVPAAWQYIKRMSGRLIGRFSGQLRYIEMGSAALPVEDKRLLMELLPATRLCMHYGLTEASRAMFSEFHADADHLNTVGRPLAGKVEACVLDDAGNPVADGMDGEICVRGNMVMTSYYEPRDNDRAFHGEWFRTGDWGHRDTDGRFYLTGRVKELINVGGEKVSPVTIERAIKSLGVEDCACVPVPDPVGVLGEVPKVYIKLSGTTMTLDELKRGLADLLPQHELPAQWEWIDEIPRTASGKIQRLKLKQQ